MKGGVVLVLVLLLVALAAPAVAQVAPQHSDPSWQAAYWNNTTLSGAPVLQREEAGLDYNWGAGSPHPSVRADGFSARWTRYLDLAGGTYRFTTTSDDGLRLYIDGTLILDEWNDHAARTVSVDRAVTGGHHLVTVEFYENLGDAVAKVSWAPVQSITHWRGEYFNNKTLSGSPLLVRNDVDVNFRWGTGSPASGTIPANGFSARWTRTLDLAAGSYRFSVTADDGVRLWVNGHLLIDAWKDQAPATYGQNIYLPGGGVPVKMEYYENTGGATAVLSWQRSDGAAPTPTPPPAGSAIIVDNGDAGFVKGGTAASWRRELEGYDGDLLWTKNNDYARPNYNWARWYPKLKAGSYEVFVYIPHRFTTTAQARYWVSHAGGYTRRIVDQSAYSNQWVSLGTYRFSGTDEDYVSLADVTGEAYLTTLIAWDAARFEKR
jgi:hypothetical protein